MQPSAVRRQASAIRFAVICAVLTACCGCQQLGAIAFLFRPREIQKAEFRFPRDSRVALLIDPAHPEADNPVFARGLHERLEDYFQQYRSKAELVPRRNVIELRQRHGREFADWSVQRIGRELDADYVLYVRVDSLDLRQAPDLPLIAPEVHARMKVIAVDHPAVDARVWPEQAEGRPVTCKRQASEVGDTEALDDEAAKLGADTAYFVMLPFFDVDLEEKPPVER